VTEAPDLAAKRRAATESACSEGLLLRYMRLAK